jgi:hypothetical protein
VNERLEVTDVPAPHADVAHMCLRQCGRSARTAVTAACALSLFALEAATGMRGGELRGWEVTSLDMLRRTVRVERQLVQYRPEPGRARARVRAARDAHERPHAGRAAVGLR